MKILSFIANIISWVQKFLAAMASASIEIKKEKEKESIVKEKAAVRKEIDEGEIDKLNDRLKL